MTRKQRRLTLIGSGVATIAAALGLVSFAMRDSIVFFHTPSEIQAKRVSRQSGHCLQGGGWERGGERALPGSSAGPVP